MRQPCSILLLVSSCPGGVLFCFDVYRFRRTPHLCRLTGCAVALRCELQQPWAKQTMFSAQAVREKRLEPLVASLLPERCPLLLVARMLLVAMPGAPSSVLAPEA